MDVEATVAGGVSMRGQGCHGGKWRKLERAVRWRVKVVLFWMFEVVSCTMLCQILRNLRL